MPSVHKISVGADPEVFVKDIETGEICSSIGVLKGTKNRPFETKHGMVHRDNVLAEMNVIPAVSRPQFIKNVNNVMRDLEALLKAKGKTMAIDSSHMMDIRYLNNAEASKFGCNANFNAWELDNVWKPDPELAGNLRTASGHVHIGFNTNGKMTSDEQINVALACELFLGIPSVFHDQDSRRRELYGKAGSFRPKPYGIEYTVLSNYWLQNEDLMGKVFTGAVKAVKYRHAPVVTDEDHIRIIREAINDCDLDKATYIKEAYL